MIKPMENVVIEQYIVEKKKYVGKGQYGVVYRCTDTTNKAKELCAKVLHQKEVDPLLLKREIEILKLLMPLQAENENLVQVFDVLEDKDKNNLYLIMEYCNNGDLKGLMDKKKKEKAHFTVEEATKIVGQVVKGYKALFQQKIIHRDIKPANILINNGVVKIADLGMGRVIEDMNCASNFTKVGTPAYAAPQLYLDSLFSSKADVYSLGVIYYQLIYSKLPIEAKTQPELIEKLRQLAEAPIKCALETDRGDAVRPEIRKIIEQMLLFHERDRIKWMDLFASPIFDLNMVHMKLSRKLTLTPQNKVNYQDSYRVEEVFLEQPILQVARVLTTQSDLALKAHNALHDLRSQTIGLRNSQIFVLSVCISGYRYKLILNVLGLLYNQREQLSGQLAGYFDSHQLDQFAQQGNESLRLLRDYISKALNLSILQFREDECKFLNQGQSDVKLETKYLKNLIENEQNHEFNDYGDQFVKNFNEFFSQLQFEQDDMQIQVLQKLQKEIQNVKQIDQILKRVPTSILQKSQSLK